MEDSSNDAWLTIVQAPEKKSLERLYCNGSELFQRVRDHLPYLMKTYSYLLIPVAEMPAGYADTLMAVSPAWALPVVIIIGIAVSVLVSNATAKIFRIEEA